MLLQAPFAPEGERLVALARSDGTLVGVLPVVLQGRTLLPLRSVHNQHYDFVGDLPAARRMLDVLLHDPRWDVMSITDLPTDSPLVVAARERGTRTHAGVHEHRRSPQLQLPHFEERLAAKFRANLRRCERKLPGLRYERIPHYDRASFADALHIEGLAWKDAAGSAIASDPGVEHAYRALCRWGSLHGLFSLHFLRVGDRRIAELMEFEHDGTLYAMKLGYDPEYAGVSAGHLMLLHVALDAERRGLRVFDFLGRDDEWKHKWTEQTRSFVTLDFYRATPKGIARWVVQEELKPQVVALAPRLVALARRAREHHPVCQRQTTLAAHPLLERLIYRSQQGLGIRSGLARLRNPPPPPGPPFGHPSRHVAGSLVHVREREEIERTLDARGRLRGLSFVPAQWDYCGRVVRVQRQVLRILDDRGKFRAVSGTTLLEGLDCGGPTGTAGCGRHCPLMFRDEWIESVDGVDAKIPEAPAEPKVWAEVRSEAEIRETLDRRGRHDGVMFTPDIAAFAGKRLPIKGRLETVFEHEQWLSPKAPVFILDGAHCSGSCFGEEGPCHRACALLWHADWFTDSSRTDRAPSPR
jgi:CelD/BcsL family acetyltransferase involved in cellulose biosynthesis